MNQQDNVFLTIQKKIMVNDFINAFKKRKMDLKDVILLEMEEKKIIAKLTTTFGDKIIVEKDCSKLSWKLNSLPMGEVMGKEIYDVAGDYQYQKSK
jgi:hypothetical protein